MADMHKFSNSLMRSMMISGIGIVFVFLFVANPVFAQTSLNFEEPIELSDDLLNDPIAQDILKKIDQTKK